MQDFLTWGAIIIAGGSIVAVIKFWMDMGGSQATAKADSAAAHDRAEEAAELAKLASAKHDLLLGSLNDFKVEAARTYATTKALSEAEVQLANGLERSVIGIYTRLDNMTNRLDSLITLANRPEGR